MASRAATGRAIAIIAGLLLAGLAAFLIWRYVSTADQRAQEGAELVDVFVAVNGGIPEGMTAQTAVSQNLIELDQFPSENRPETALTSLEQISGLAAIAPIFDGAVLQQGQWDDPTLADIDFEVEEGRVAISFQLGVPQGVNGYLSQGDRIGVIGYIEAEGETTSTTIGPDGNPVETTAEGEAAESRAEFLVRDAEVLAVGRRVIVTDDEGNQEDQVQQTTEQVAVTLSITASDAEKMVFQYNANPEERAMHFALLPESGELADTSGRTFDNLFQE